MNPTPRLRRRTTLLLAATPLLLVPACSDNAGPARAEADAGPSSAPTERLAFTFTGERGEAGCRYDGPRTAGVDPVSTLVNSSPNEAYVTFARLANGATVEDFHAYLGTLGSSYPVRVPAEDHDPAVHEWMDGGWRQVHTAGAGATHEVTSTTFAEGDYVVFCFRDAGGGSSDLWPLEPLSISAG